MSKENRQVKQFNLIAYEYLKEMFSQISKGLTL